MNITAIIMLIVIPITAIFIISKLSRIIARFFVSPSLRTKYKEALEFDKRRQNADIDC